MKKIILLIATILFAKEVYFMPMDGEIAQKRLSELFSHAHQNIKITIYTFTNKKLARALKIAAKKGVKITIIADKKEAKFRRSVIPNLAAIKNIKVLLLSGKRYKNGDRAKMHVKMSIIDDKYLVIGSANYSYSAFFKNYEYVLIEKDKTLISEFENFFKKLKVISTPYRLSR
ncbi:phospholipase D-like domain-containing protein [Caminibacter pacificus]